MTLLPPDYAGHERAYQQLRSRGAEGWSPGAEYETMWRLVAPGLPPPNAAMPPSVLELGCGAGNFSCLLANRGYRAFGVDISATAIAWAGQVAGDAGIAASFEVDNVLTLGTCADRMFDAVVDGHCFHCIVGEDRSACLDSVRRVLKPGGCFVVLTMCGEVVDPRIRAMYDPHSGLVVVDGRPTRYIGSAESIAAEVRRAGFEIDRLRVVPRQAEEGQDDLVIHCHKPA